VTLVGYTMCAGGHATLELLKPPDVAISVTARSATGAVEGPYDASGGSAAVL